MSYPDQRSADKNAENPDGTPQNGFSKTRQTLYTVVYTGFAVNPDKNETMKGHGQCCPLTSVPASQTLSIINIMSTGIRLCVTKLLNFREGYSKRL